MRRLTSVKLFAKEYDLAVNIASQLQLTAGEDEDIKYSQYYT